MITGTSVQLGERIRGLGWVLENHFTEDGENLAEEFKQFEITIQAFEKSLCDELLLFLKCVEGLEMYHGAVTAIVERRLGPNCRVTSLREETTMEVVEELYGKRKKKMFQIAGEHEKPEMSAQLDRKCGEYPSEHDFNGRKPWVGRA